MAKVTHGPLISDARCKVGGIIFSRGRGGPYSRAFVVPINPNTNDQQYVRGCFQDMMLRWQTALTDIQRQGWDSFAHQFPVSNPISGKRPLAGVQAFLRMNQRSYNRTGVWMDDPPVDQAVTHLTWCEINQNQTGPDVLTITASATPQVDEYILVLATVPISAGILNFRRNLRFVTAFDSTVTYPVDLWTPWNAKNWYKPLPPPPTYYHPVLIVGKRVGIQCFVTNTLNWADGSKVEASSITT